MTDIQVIDTKIVEILNEDFKAFFQVIGEQKKKVFGEELTLREAYLVQLALELAIQTISKGENGEETAK